MNQPQRKHVIRDWAGWGWGGSWEFESPWRIRVITPIRYLNTENAPERKKKRLLISCRIRSRKLKMKMILYRPGQPNWEYTIFCHTDFTWNQFWAFWTAKVAILWPFEKFWILDFWHFQVWNISKNQHWKPPKLLKWHFLTFSNQSQLISRKIKVEGKLPNFHNFEYPHPKFPIMLTRSVDFAVWKFKLFSGAQIYVKYPALCGYIPPTMRNRGI